MLFMHQQLAIIAMTKKRILGKRVPQKLNPSPRMTSVSSKAIVSCIC